VSLIESALAKLRRNAPDAPQTAVAVVAPLSPPREYTLKRINIDSQALRRAGYLPDEGLERRFADHFRQIKRPLIDKALAGGAPMRLIVVSSALPGDGKTFNSINLAVSIARERDLSVLLVDADTPRARISQVFDIRGERGLLDALADETLDVESLVVETDMRGFEILPAGTFIEGAPELIASARMEQIASRLAARNARQLILFDSPPLLISSEARALVRIPGQVVLVMHQGVTPLHAALDALAYVDRAKLQGVILNQAVVGQGVRYYDGYYDHGYADETPRAG
jgi:protein-tyrosine kinase